jgi:hypothetical protein
MSSEEIHQTINTEIENTKVAHSSLITVKSLDEKATVTKTPVVNGQSASVNSPDTEVTSKETMPSASKTSLNMPPDSKTSDTVLSPSKIQIDAFNRALVLSKSDTQGSNSHVSLPHCGVSLSRSDSKTIQEEEIDTEYGPYGKYYEEITEKHLKKTASKLGRIKLCWPQQLIPDVDQYVCNYI